MTLTPEQQLHDRATLGETLSPDEQAQLERWYELLNQQQMNAIFRHEQPVLAMPSQGSERLAALQQQIDTLLAHLSMMMTRIQTISEQNKTLRAEILLLHHKAAQRMILEAA